MGTAGRKQEDPAPERPHTQATKVGCAGEGPASEDIGPQRVHVWGGHEPNSKGSAVCSERFMAACSEELKHRPVFQQWRVGGAVERRGQFLREDSASGRCLQTRENHMFLPTEKCTKKAGGSQGGPRGRASEVRPQQRRKEGVCLSTRKQKGEDRG